jgi:hypothetical protein
MGCDSPVSRKVENIEEVNTNNESDLSYVGKDVLEMEVERGDRVPRMDLDGIGQGFLIPDDPPLRELGLNCTVQATKETADADHREAEARLIKCSLLQESCDDTTDETGLGNMSSGEMEVPECEEESHDGWQQGSLARKKAQIQATRHSLRLKIHGGGGGQLRS